MAKDSGTMTEGGVLVFIGLQTLGGRLRGERDAPLLADRLYLLSIVGGLIRTAFLQSFLLSGYLPAYYSHLFVSISSKYNWEKRWAERSGEISESNIPYQNFASTASGKIPYSPSSIIAMASW